MNHSLAVSLPPLRRKILRSFLLMVAFYGVVGIFMMVAVFLASGITPKIMHVNYDSIASANEMREAIRALRHPDENPEHDPKGWASQFETALKFEESNV